MKLKVLKLSVLASSLFLSSCSFFHKHEVDKDVRMMTFNIRYDNHNDGENRWDLRKNELASFLAGQNQDIIGLQEVLHHQLVFLMNNLPDYAYVGVGRGDGKTSSEYIPILYKKSRFEVLKRETFWFSQTPKRPGSTTWQGIPRICTWAEFFDKRSGKKLRVYNIHLDHQSQQSREKSMLILNSKLKDRGDAKVVVLGDFNSAEENRATLYLKGKTMLEEHGVDIQLRDSFRMLYPNEKTVGTFNRFQNKTDGAKIDHIFIESDMKVKGAEIDRVLRYNGLNISDHFPVKTVFELL